MALNQSLLDFENVIYLRVDVIITKKMVLRSISFD
jgi:hypothetical protein